VRDPLKGRAREDCSLAGALRFQYAPVDGAGLVLEFGEVGQAGVAADVAGAVDDGLDAQRAAVFQVILSVRVSRGCDLRRPVVDSVADGTLAGLSGCFQLP
jgi:hypothetical protein